MATVGGYDLTGAQYVPDPLTYAPIGGYSLQDPAPAHYTLANGQQLTVDQYNTLLAQQNQANNTISFNQAGTSATATGQAGSASINLPSYADLWNQSSGLYGNIMDQYGGVVLPGIAQNAINQQNLYGSVYGNVMGTLNNYGQAAQQLLDRQYAQQQSSAMQGLINSGLANTTVSESVKRGIGLDQALATANLQNQLAGTVAGYQSQIGLAQASALGDYNNLFANTWGNRLNYEGAYGQNLLNQYNANAQQAAQTGLGMYGQQVAAQNAQLGANTSVATANIAGQYGLANQYQQGTIQSLLAAQQHAYDYGGYAGDFSGA